MFSSNDIRNSKERPEESSISQVNTIVPPSEGNLIHPDKIRDPVEGRGCVFNCFYMALLGFLVLGIITVLLIAFPNVWLPPMASFIIPEYKYPSFYNEPDIRASETIASTSQGIPISHHDLVLRPPYDRYRDSTVDEEQNSVIYDFPEEVSLTIQRGQPQNLDPTGTINLSLIKVEDQIFETTYADLNGCEGIEDCLTYFTLILTKKMILDTQPDRDSGHTIASGSWSKFSNDDATIYQMDKIFSEDGGSQSVTLFVIPQTPESDDPYTLPSLKELMATYATSTDSDVPPALSDQNVYSITITAPNISQRDIDTIAGSISLL